MIPERLSKTSQTVEAADARPSVQVPAVCATLDLLDRLVAVRERAQALDGPASVAANPALREGETEQRHIELAPAFE